ncbi:MAG: hypothetical protein HOP30_11140 [Cyclobacteriaceae bacterium]|nr:hypothetical protein [Cyclobacteriaceae bacterium]
MTVLEAFKELGLAYSQLTLSVVGRHIARLNDTRIRMESDIDERLNLQYVMKWQQENGQLIYVRDYEFDRWLKKEIIKFISAKHSKNYIESLMNRNTGKCHTQ